jgi:hypothetical protein
MEAPLEMLLDDYSGPFDPDFSPERFSRQALADLGREYLLNGHLQDRVGLPRVAMRSDPHLLTQISIDEWMGASPIYSKRVQRAFGFEGHDVATIFKNLQLDIGAPHQFMEFRFDLDGPRYGEFWLERCGPLLDVEPFGEQRVRLMCHDVEDPTFDATAAATHPCAKIRPIHRPPRVPSARIPHCRWKVFIDDASVASAPHPNLAIVSASKLAQVAVRLPAADAQPGGWPDYAGSFDPEFQLEDFSHRALVAANLEFAVQSHLLARSFLLAVEQRCGAELVPALATEQWTGIAGLTAERLRRAARIGGDGLDAIAKLFQLHPCFHPRDYVDLRIALEADAVRVAFGECPAFDEGDAYSWFAHLGAAPHPALDAIAGAVNPRASARPAAPRAGERLAFRVEIDPAAKPRGEPADVALAKLSRGATIVFERRRPLRD